MVPDQEKEHERVRRALINIALGMGAKQEEKAATTQRSVFWLAFQLSNRIIREVINHERWSWLNVLACFALIIGGVWGFSLLWPDSEPGAGVAVDKIEDSLATDEPKVRDDVGERDYLLEARSFCGETEGEEDLVACFLVYIFGLGMEIDELKYMIETYGLGNGFDASEYADMIEACGLANELCRSEYEDSFYDRAPP